MERIICAAIWLKDGNVNHAHQPRNITSGIVICGLRHAHCFATISEMPALVKLALTREEQGFITSNHNFLNRTEAMELALKAGQVKIDDLIMPTIGLDSSDLY